MQSSAGRNLREVLVYMSKGLEENQSSEWQWVEPTVEEFKHYNPYWCNWDPGKDFEQENDMD